MARGQVWTQGGGHVRAVTESRLLHHAGRAGALCGDRPAAGPARGRSVHAYAREKEKKERTADKTGGTRERVGQGCTGVASAGQQQG